MYWLETPTGKFQMADHIEIEHERELGVKAWTAYELVEMHREMHRDRDDWPHTHRKSEADEVLDWQT